MTTDLHYKYCIFFILHSSFNRSTGRNVPIIIISSGHSIPNSWLLSFSTHRANQSQWKLVQSNNKGSQCKTLCIAASLCFCVIFIISRFCRLQSVETMLLLLEAIIMINYYYYCFSTYILWDCRRHSSALLSVLPIREARRRKNQKRLNVSVNGWLLFYELFLVANMR